MALRPDIAAAQAAHGSIAGNQQQAKVIDELARIRELVRLARWHMRRADEPSVLNPPPHRHARLAVIPERYLPVCYVLGPLEAPLNGELEGQVRALLDRGERAIVLDLAGTSTIDAAGIGELVGAYNSAIAAGCTLRVVRPATRVRQILERVGFFDVLRQG